MTTSGKVEVAQPPRDGERILTPDAVEFVVQLERRFGPARAEVLHARDRRQREIDAGADFEMAADGPARQGSWSVAPPAPGLEDRRVEITGPVERRMTINALNSGAKVWLADFEDALTPTWAGLVSGQANLVDALDRTITYTSPEGKQYELGDDPATIVVRPRGWHLPEKHLVVDGSPASASLVDFGLHLFHGARRQIDVGHGPYFYLPKLEGSSEARLWNEVFEYAQDYLGIPRGTIRATVLIETVPAAFEMEEILYELRDHSAGLNAGRWDYLFSLIKKYRNRGAGYVLPDRADVTMTAPFMQSYCELLVRTCHRRGAHAIGGMAAFVPSRRDPEVNARALDKVREDKTREAKLGFDGSWVAHPDLVPVCREVFDAALGAKPNQLDHQPGSQDPSGEALLDIGSATGSVTDAGLRNNLGVALRYLAAWLDGTGAVAIYNLMEDAATAEIARTQVWQWRMNGTRTSDDDRPVTAERVRAVIDEELVSLAASDDGFATLPTLQAASELLAKLCLDDEFAEFLTLPAYDLID